MDLTEDYTFEDVINQLTPGRKEAPDRAEKMII